MLGQYGLAYHPFVNGADLNAAEWKDEYQYSLIVWGSVANDDGDAGANAYTVVAGTRIATNLQYTYTWNPRAITEVKAQFDLKELVNYVPFGAPTDFAAVELYTPIWEMRSSEQKAH